MKYLTSLFIAFCIVMVVFATFTVLFWILPMIIEWYCGSSSIVQVLAIGIPVLTIYISFWVYSWLYA